MPTTVAPRHVEVLGLPARLKQQAPALTQYSAIVVHCQLRSVLSEACNGQNMNRQVCLAAERTVKLFTRKSEVLPMRDYEHLTVGQCCF